MNKSNIPLRLNVGYLYNKPIGTSRDIPVDFNQLEIEDILIKDLRSLVRVSRTREGLLLQMKGECKVETTCTRCLDVFFLPVEVEFEELYQFPSRKREDTDLLLPHDGFIDLSSIYREYLILAMPIKRICQQDCKGLCVVCGVNLNSSTCEHYPKTDSSAEKIMDGETA